MTDLDPRLNAYRPDLADIALSGQLAAESYSAGAELEIRRGAADLRRAPEPGAPLESQLLFGEKVSCFERKSGWAWVQNRRDGYVGYLRADALGEPRARPSHQVSALRTLLFPAPDLKAPILDSLSMASPVAVIARSGDYSEIDGGGWIYTEHLTALDQPQPDYTATALAFLGTPYLWGGRSSLGLDCSALVQLALALAGMPCRRDSGQQETSLGPMEPWRPGTTRPRYGDLIYMADHVAIALDETRVVHATAHGLQVRIEPLADLEARVQADGGITALLRPRLDSDQSAA